MRTITISMIKPFVYLSEYRVVVCTECEYGLSAGGVRAHLAGQHPDILDEERGSIAEEISRIPGIIRDEQELESFQFPGPATTAIPELAAPKTDGLGCKACWYVSRQQQKIQEHCRSEHNWRNKRKRGQKGGAQADDLPWVGGVRCQRFFRTRVNSRWFEVEGKADRAGNWIDRGASRPKETRSSTDGSESSGDDVVLVSSRAIASSGGLGSRSVSSMFSSGLESDSDDVPLICSRTVNCRADRHALVNDGQSMVSSQATDASSQLQPVIIEQTAGGPAPDQRDPGREYIGLEVIKLIRYLEHWSMLYPLCPLCHLMEDDSDVQHQIEDCTRTRPPAQAIGRAIQAVERGLHEVGAFALDGVCPQCGVPRELDDKLSGHRDGLPEGRCKYKGVLAGGFVTMYVAGFPEGIAVLRDWFGRAGLDWTDEKAGMDWVGGGVMWRGMAVAQAVVVFYMLSNKNVGKRYLGQYNMGVRSIESVEWIWKRYLD